MFNISDQTAGENFLQAAIILEVILGEISPNWKMVKKKSDNYICHGSEGGNFSHY